MQSARISFRFNNLYVHINKLYLYVSIHINTEHVCVIFRIYIDYKETFIYTISTITFNRHRQISH